MRCRLVLLVALFLVLGCSGAGYKVAPVSGRVTLDGKPLARAHVHFAPVGTKDRIAPGPTSQGQTDAEGRYTLTLDTTHRKPGAVVGMHKVYIITVDTQVTPGDRPDAGAPPKRREILPERYNQDTTLSCDVPAKGTDSANFDLESK
jgi:hypothetical protein